MKLLLDRGADLEAKNSASAVMVCAAQRTAASATSRPGTAMVMSRRSTLLL